MSKMRFFALQELANRVPYPFIQIEMFYASGVER